MTKAILVINSCLTYKQLMSAKKYAYLYMINEENMSNVIAVNDIWITKFKQLIKTL